MEVAAASDRSTDRKIRRFQPASSRDDRSWRGLRDGPPRVTVVVPTLNEARNLPHVFERLPEDLYEVVLVDGRSTDDTVAVARALRPDIRVVLETAPGKGRALRAGFEAARGDIIVMLDADGSADPHEIPRFVDALLSGADFAKGSRFLAGGGSSDITRLRRFGNKCLCRLANAFYGTSYSDLCYGYNAFWRHCLQHISVDCSGFEVETQINLRIAKAALEVAEVPSYEAERIHGTSNLNTFRDGTRVLKMIFRERAGRTRELLEPIHPADELVAEPARS